MADLPSSDAGGRNQRQPWLAGSIPPSKTESSKQLANCIIRSLTLLSSLTASVLMAIAKNTHSKFTVKPAGDTDFEYLLPPSLSLSIDLSSLIAPLVWNCCCRYFIVVHIVVTVYSTFSLVAWVAVCSKCTKVELIFATFDVVMMALLFSASGNAIPIGAPLRMGYGEHYDMKCNVSCRFCGLVAAAAATSMLTAAAFLLVSVSFFFSYWRHRS